MADFALLNENQPKQVQNYYPNGDPYAYNPGVQGSAGGMTTGNISPYKVMSGATRGDQQIKGRIMVVDSKNVTRLVMGFDPGNF